MHYNGKQPVSMLGISKDNELKGYQLYRGKMFHARNFISCLVKEMIKIVTENSIFFYFCSKKTTIYSLY